MAPKILTVRRQFVFATIDRGRNLNFCQTQINFIPFDERLIIKAKTFARTSAFEMVVKTLTN
jgi:hypothetical protein